MYTPEKTMNYEGLVAWTAAQVMAGRPLIEGPVRLALEVACAVPASWSMKKTAAALRGEVRPTTKPDLDNIAKIAGDALNGVVWRDDVQVVTLSAHKRYSESPSLSFFIEAL